MSLPTLAWSHHGPSLSRLTIMPGWFYGPVTSYPPGLSLVIGSPGRFVVAWFHCSRLVHYHCHLAQLSVAIVIFSPYALIACRLFVMKPRHVTSLFAHWSLVCLVIGFIVACLSVRHCPIVVILSLSIMSREKEPKTQAQ